MAEKDEDDFKEVVKTVYDVVMEHPSITFDVTIAECLKLRNFYRVTSLMIFCQVHISAIFRTLCNVLIFHRTNIFQRWVENNKEMSDFRKVISF